MNTPKSYFFEDYKLINPYQSHTPVGFYDPVKGHTGVDYATPVGVPLALPVPVTVLKCLKQQQMGTTLYVKDPDGNILVFSHLSSCKYSYEIDVPAGEVFAHTGNTGSATTGPHLHFEVIAETPEPGGEHMKRSLAGYYGYNIDPVPYLNRLTAEPYAGYPGLSYLYQHGMITDTNHRPTSAFIKEEIGLIIQRALKKSEEWILAKVDQMVEDKLKEHGVIKK